jgi:hypothetical protein
VTIVLPARVVAHHVVAGWYAVPFVVVTVATGLAVTRFRSGQMWAMFPLLGLAIASGGFAVSDAAKSPQIVRDHTLTATFHRLVRPRDVVLAEPFFWWVDPTPGFRSNSVIWLSHAINGWSFEESVHRICPNMIVVDKLWLNRYEAKTDFPSLAPTDPAEKAVLVSLLRREYALVETVEAAGDRITFWRRAGPNCSAAPQGDA